MIMARLSPLLALWLSASSAVCQGSQGAPILVCSQAQSLCPHVYKNGNFVEIGELAGASVIVGVQETIGLLRFEMVVGNTGSSTWDLVPTQMHAYAFEPKAKELSYLSKNDLRSRFFAQGFTAPVPIPPLPAIPNLSSSMGSAVVSGPQGTNVYSYSSQTLTTSSDPVATSTQQSPKNAGAAIITTYIDSVLSTLLQAQTLQPGAMGHGVLYFRLPSRKAKEICILIPANGQTVEFHFVWPQQ